MNKPLIDIAKNKAAPELDAQALALLAVAEDLYGPRTSGWEFEGVHFANDAPRLWSFYETGSTVPDFVRIHVTPSVRDNPDQALYQLAHEVIHMLAPTCAPCTIIFEEGLAVKFSLEQRFQSDWYAEALRNRRVQGENYHDAWQLAEQFLLLAPDIKQLRRLEPAFHNWTPAFLVANIPGMDPVFATALCERRMMR